MKHTMVLTVGLLLVCGCSGCDGVAGLFASTDQAAASGRNAQPFSELRSGSLRLPRQHLEQYLRGLADLVDEGIDRHLLDRIRETMEDTSAPEGRVLQFPVVYRGESTTLEIEFFLDDPQIPEIYFFATPELVQRIDAFSAEFTRTMAEYE